MILLHYLKEEIFVCEDLFGWYKDEYIQLPTPKALIMFKAPLDIVLFEYIKNAIPLFAEKGEIIKSDMGFVCKFKEHMVIVQGDLPFDIVAKILKGMDDYANRDNG